MYAYNIKSNVNTLVKNLKYFKEKFSEKNVDNDEITSIKFLT